MRCQLVQWLLRLGRPNEHDVQLHNVGRFGYFNLLIMIKTVIVVFISNTSNDSKKSDNNKDLSRATPKGQSMASGKHRFTNAEA